MAAQDLVLPPSEYSGEPNTWVGGRVVLSRITRVQQTRKGKAKGKGKPAPEETNKCEVHILGGANMSEMLFVDGWAEAAQAFVNICVRGLLVKIKNPKVIFQRPQYSTSRLPYYIRIIGPTGTQTIVQVMDGAGSPWTQIPTHHPFVDIEALRRVSDSLHVCIVAIVAEQPGAVARTTPYGESKVCNALIRLKDTTIRTSFWRQNAIAMSGFPQGSAVALYLVKVVKTGADTWEIRGTEGTAIEACPTDLEEGVRQTTDLQQAPDAGLTRTVARDYETVATSPSCVGALMSLIVPQKPRELGAVVYEVHSLTMLGFGAVLKNDSFFMVCCARCKRQLAEGADRCGEHPDDGVENRWIAKISIADSSGSGDAMVYHDVLEPTGVMPAQAVALSPQQVVSITRRLRSTPWSARLVYRTNDSRQQNYLEVKKLEPTLTEGGVLRSWSLQDVPEVHIGQGCPFVKCADVT